MGKFVKKGAFMLLVAFLAVGMANCKSGLRERNATGSACHQQYQRCDYRCQWRRYQWSHRHNGRNHHFKNRCRRNVCL